MSKISEKQQIFLDAYYDLVGQGHNPRDSLKKAKELAGYDTRMTFKSIVRGIPISIIQEYNNTALMELTPRAIYRVNDIMEDGGQHGARNSLAAAMTILDRQGTSKREIVDFNVQSENGLVFIPAKKAVEDATKEEEIPEA